ncbi:MAG: hypothetical protein RLY70_138 [Planctomycetota bacterium]|jgi:hypothetical protein
MSGGPMPGGPSPDDSMPGGGPLNAGTTMTPWQCGQETCWPAIDGNTWNTPPQCGHPSGAGSLADGIPGGG